MSSVIDSCGVLAWKAAALQWNKGKAHSFCTPFSASFLGSLSEALLHLIHLKHLCHYFSLLSVPTVLAGQLLNFVIFPHNQTNRDLTLFLTGSCCRNQMSFLLRSAGVWRKKRLKNSFNLPRPWLTELAKIKNIHTKVQTLKNKKIFKCPWQTVAFLLQCFRFRFLLLIAISIWLLKQKT